MAKHSLLHTPVQVALHGRAFCQLCLLKFLLKRVCLGQSKHLLDDLLSIGYFKSKQREDEGAKAHICRVDVLDCQRQTEGLEPCSDSIFQPWAHISQNLVATCTRDNSSSASQTYAYLNNKHLVLALYHCHHTR